MTVQPNGTDAKDIAVHFFDMSGERVTPGIMKRTIVMAKTLLSSGYSKDEIIKVIDYIINVKHVEMYSLGYVSVTINNVLKEIKKSEELASKKEASEEIKEQIKVEQQTKQSEVESDEQSKQRNKSKLRNLGVQSRFGKEFNLDLFEVQRQDD